MQEYQNLNLSLTDEEQCSKFFHFYCQMNDVEPLCCGKFIISTNRTIRRAWGLEDECYYCAIFEYDAKNYILLKMNGFSVKIKTFDELFKKHKNHCYLNKYCMVDSITCSFRKCVELSLKGHDDKMYKALRHASD